jgi:hypothetical protein
LNFNRSYSEMNFSGNYRTLWIDCDGDAHSILWVFQFFLSISIAFSTRIESLHFHVAIDRILVDVGVTRNVKWKLRRKYLDISFEHR